MTEFDKIIAKAKALNSNVTERAIGIIRSDFVDEFYGVLAGLNIPYAWINSAMSDLFDRYVSDVLSEVIEPSMQVTD